MAGTALHTRVRLSPYDLVKGGRDPTLWPLKAKLMHGNSPHTDGRIG